MQQFMVHDFMQKILLFHVFKDQVETKYIYIDFQCVPKIILYIHNEIKINQIFRGHIFYCYFSI